METLSVLQSLIMALWVAGRCPESDDCHRSITNDLHGCFFTRWLYASRTINCGSDCCASCVARKFEAGSGYRRSGSCRSFRKLFISIPFLY